MDITMHRQSVRLLLVFLFCYFPCLFCLVADFDAVVIGSSPTCLFEALYQHHSGKRVAIVEAGARYGGAWTTIDICGIAHVDMGCHEIGNRPEFFRFLEDYAGCKMVSLQDPRRPLEAGKRQNCYFSGGCHELLTNLTSLIAATNITAFTGQSVDRISIDSTCDIAILHLGDSQLTTTKVFLTPNSHLTIDNGEPPPRPISNFTYRYYPHLYLLLDDPTPYRFTYSSGIGAGVTRMMNCTPFLDIEDSGKQLIALQIHNGAFQKYEQGYLPLAEMCLDGLKKYGLVHATAKLSAFDTYIYKQGTYRYTAFEGLTGANRVLKILNTGHLDRIMQHIPRWTLVLPLFTQLNQPKKT